MWKGIISFAIQDRLEVAIERRFEKSAIARHRTESSLEYSKQVLNPQKGVSGPNSFFFEKLEIEDRPIDRPTNSTYLLSLLAGD